MSERNVLLGVYVPVGPTVQPVALSIPYARGGFPNQSLRTATFNIKMRRKSKEREVGDGGGGDRYVMFPLLRPRLHFNELC